MDESAGRVIALAFVAREKAGPKVARTYFDLQSSNPRSLSRRIAGVAAGRRRGAHEELRPSFSFTD